MRSKKLCYGLLLALPIMFGLSLSVSSNTSALKYAYNAYPIFDDNFYKCDTGDQSSCQGYTWHGGSSFGINFSNVTNDLDSNLLSASHSAYLRCGESVPPYSNLRNLWTANYSSSNLSIGSGYLKKRVLSNYGQNSNFGVGCQWDYDHIYSASYNTSNGELLSLVNVPRLFFDTDDPNYNSGSITSINVPLNLSSDSLTHVSSGTLMEWDFGLVQGGLDFPYIDENLVASLDISYHTLDPNTSSFNDFFSSWKSTTNSSIFPRPTCTVDFDYSFGMPGDEPLTIIPYTGFNVHCSYTAPSDLYYVYPTLSIRGSGSQYNPSVFLTYSSHDLYFSGTYYTTNGDSTWSGEYANATPTGEQIEWAPGYHQLYGWGDTVCGPDDFFCNLTNLFTFNVINPFYPIYSLFSDNNSCASIPIIAGMLHSNETTICPWFDSQTRNIMTPVIGLASSMLLFGFIVRWLGSRSGNFVEDSVNADNIDSYDGRNFGKHSMVGRFRRHK